MTTLVDRVRDQAALVGLLNSLYDLRLPLVAVQMLRCDGASHSRGKQPVRKGLGWVYTSKTSATGRAKPGKTSAPGMVCPMS